MYTLFVIFMTIAVYAPFAFFFLDMDNFSLNEWKAKRRSSIHQRTQRKYQRIVARRYR